MSNVLIDLSNALAAAAERAGKATVLVNARRRFPASGIVYAADLVLTADHVIERDEDISVMLFDGTEIPAKLAGRDPGSDLALLRLERPVADVAEPAAESPRIGQLALVLGRPTAEGIQASLGVISAVGGPLHTPRGVLDRHIRTDAISYPGFSGGPTVAADGTILGLNTSGLMGGAPLTIPVDVAWRVADHLAKHGSVRRGYLGIRSQPVEIPSAQQKALGRNQAAGLMLVGIEDGSPAEKGGLLMGDMLVGFNGVAVANHEELFAGLAGDIVDKTIAIEVLRAGAKQTLNIKIEARPESHAEEHHHHHEHGHHGGHGHHEK